MNDGKLNYEIAMDYNASGGNQAKHHIDQIKAGYLAFNQLLRGDVVGAIQSANRSLQGFSSSLSGTLGLIARFAGPLLAGFSAGKFLDNSFGISDKIANAIVPAIKVNTEISKSLEKLREINKLKLDSVTKEFEAFAEAIKKTSDQTLELIRLTNEANFSKAPTENEQYRVSQSGKVDAVKLMVAQRDITAQRLKEAEGEYFYRQKRADAFDDRNTRAAKSGNVDSSVAKNYRIEAENSRKSAVEMGQVIIKLQDSLNLLDKQIEAAGAAITQSSREMEKGRQEKAAEIDKQWSDQLVQMQSDAESGQKESFASDPRPLWEKLKDKYTQPYERQAPEQKATEVSRRKFNYSQMSPEEQLVQTEKEIKMTRRAASSKKVSPEERDALKQDYYERLAPEQARLKKEISSASEKTKLEATSRADKIRDAQENISNANQRQISGASMGDVFSRMYDVKKGRTPADSAAQQTADNTRIIAENTAQLKQLGAIQ